MRKALFMLMCLVAMGAACTGLEAQEVTIMLKPGWTWISYPSADTVDFATALGTFTPRQGDVIACEYEYSEYYGGEWVGDIQQFYPGYGYMYYSTRNMPVFLTFNLQQPAPQVLVTTDTPQLITGNSAIGGGNVTVSNGTYILVRGICWATHESPTTNEDFFLEEGSGVGSFTATMTGLNISTTYYVRAYAVTANSTMYGEQQSFTTRDGIPTLTTAEVTNITGATATCGGNISDNGGLNVTARGVCWSTSPNPTVADTHTTNGSGSGSFSSSITGLNVSTTYYVRAYATTTAGTAYGEQKTFISRDGVPILTTTAVTNIGSSYAYSGGNITDDGGLSITSRGVCWSTSPNPTIADSHTTNGSGTGDFSSYITGLSFDTTYFIRAYASNSHTTVYGNQLNFNTLEGYVDLGLPSGLLWATCNVGAGAPEEYGDYFAWGETATKDTYNWSTYQYCNGSYNTLTKYCNRSSYGNNGFTDNLTTLLSEDDAATANWGDDWRMPTKEEWQELYNNTTSTWTTQNGVSGRLFTANNGNSLFLPAAGMLGGIFSNIGNTGYYWSSSLSTGYCLYARCFIFESYYYSLSYDHDRFYGISVRPVRCKSSVIDVSANPTEGGDISGGGFYQDHTSCTVSATANDDYVFLYWTEDGRIVSTEATYTFIVNGNRSLVANFITGAIDGKFTINADGDQVYFSQGNLQYSGSTWRFAEHQYDYIGDANSNPYNEWIDLFGWGTSGWYCGNLYYHPWDYDNSSGSAYGPPGVYDLTGSYAFSDWGVYNQISNGGNTYNQWRTLTQPEWDYVFNTRNTTSGIRYAKANVNNVNGVILLPDNWNTSTYNLNNTNINNANFSSNTITVSQWTILENAGAVFLPAAGNRYGTDVFFVGTDGNYWSSTSYPAPEGAYNMGFADTGLSTDGGSDRYSGLSVRLVVPLWN